LVALLIVLFLLKRKKKDPKEIADDECTETDTTLSTAGDDDVYISEYGLSDGVRPVDPSEDCQDLPQAVSTGGNYESDIENASEHNPEFEDAMADPGEA
jgi:hypothetical protein